MPSTPALVKLSLCVYRLLLALYPKPFRNKYGDLMMQLFCDTARDGYWSRGLRGLLAVWLRTLTDLTVSLGQQHREETMCQAQALSLRNLIQQWLALGSALLSVIALTLRYVLQLIFRRPLRTCAVASMFILVLWTMSFHDFRFLSFRVKVVPDGMWCRIHHGVMDLDNGYFRRQPPPAKPWEFRYFSWEIPHSRRGWLGYVWLLRIPVPVLFVFILLFYLGTRGLRGNARAGPAMQSV
jgi:hypothetical protein